MAAVHELAPVLGNAGCLRRCGPVARRTRARRAQASAQAHHGAFVGLVRPRAPRPRPPLALNEAENQRVLDTLNSERFADTAPAVSGAINASIPLAHTKPELLAQAPNQVWSWDITKSHSRPYVSDDNPYSEAQFKTLKYRPDFPARFGCIEDARAHCQAFFAWYNAAHRHSGIGYMTPHSVHHGQAEQLRGARQAVLDEAFLATPKRVKGRRPEPHALPTAVWINPPPPQTITPKSTQPCAVNS